VDEFDLTARAWKVGDQLVRLCAEAERKWGIEPMRLDRVDDAVNEYLADISDEGTQERLYHELAEFWEAVLFAMD
jgi:hypothetical protein